MSKNNSEAGSCESIKIPSEMVKYIESSEWFNTLYINLEDFVRDATRRFIENWMIVYKEDPSKAVDNLTKVLKILERQ